MNILHVLNMSPPYLHGYSIRSANIMSFQKKLGLLPIAITSPKHTLFSEIKEEINGITYYRTKTSNNHLLDKIPFVREKVLMSRFFRKILRVAQENSVDLIHAHSPTLCGIPALKAAKRMHVPFIYEMRAIWEDSAVEQKKFSKNSFRYKLSRFIETRLLQKADVVTTISQGLVNEICGRGVDAKRIFTIPNGVDTEKFAPLKKDGILVNKFKLNSNVVVGFIGSFFRGEGVDLLIKAWPEILKKCSNAKLLIVGGGLEEENIKELIIHNDMVNSIKYVGQVPHKDILKYYSLGDIFVYPRIPERLYQLVTPLKPLEAMSMGKAVLGSDVGGLKELINDGSSGLLFKAGDISDLIKKCIHLIKDETLRSNLGYQAILEMKQHRTWHEIVKDYLDIYKRLLSEKKLGK